MKLPDITPAQIVAIVGAVIGVLVAFGVDISGPQRDAVLTVVGIVSGTLIVSDAHIRNGRAQALRKDHSKH
jgi:hypothetical protein